MRRPRFAAPRKAPPRAGPKARQWPALLRLARRRVDRRPLDAAALRRGNSAERTDRAQQPHTPEQADDQSRRRCGDRQRVAGYVNGVQAGLHWDGVAIGDRLLLAASFVLVGYLSVKSAGVCARGRRVGRTDAADRDREGAARGDRTRARDAQRRTRSARDHAGVGRTARRLERDCSWCATHRSAAARRCVRSRRRRRCRCRRGAAAVDGDRLARRARSRGGRRVSRYVERRCSAE